MKIFEKINFLKKKSSETGSSLRKKMIFYFLLIAIANIFVAGEILWEIKSSAYKQMVTSKVEQIKAGEKPVEDIHEIFSHLTQKFAIMILILIIVSAVVLFMFVWQIASPIQYMIDQAEKMADGNLSIRIEIKKEDEIAILGRLINDLSINLQEVLAQLERIVFEERTILNTFNDDMEERPIKLSTVKTHIQSLEGTVKKLEMLKDAFVLYTIESLKTNTDERGGR